MSQYSDTDPIEPRAQPRTQQSVLDERPPNNMETSHDPKEQADQQPAYRFAEAQPSHAGIEAGNPAIFKPRYLVLDDINVDLLTVLVTILSFLSHFALHLPMVLTLLAAAAVIFPLRLLFPRPATPQGTVLITGASSGIGAELSYIFAERGHDLVLVGRNEEQLESVKNNIERKYGKSARAIAVDLSIPSSPKQLYEQVKNDGLAVEILVNNAGLGGAGETMEQPIELVERMTALTSWVCPRKDVQAGACSLPRVVIPAFRAA
jgi:hypothetical protein